MPLLDYSMWMSKGQSEPACRPGPDPVEVFLERTGVKEPMRTIARLATDPRCLSRREIAATAGVSMARAVRDTSTLRLLFLAPRQNELPNRILREAIRWSVTRRDDASYRLPQYRAPTSTSGMEMLGVIRGAFDRLGLTPAERDYAELLLDPEMLNEKTIAEILGTSRNHASQLRSALRMRLGAARRNQLRLLLLNASLEHAFHGFGAARACQSPYLQPVATPEGDGTTRERLENLPHELLTGARP